MKVILDTYAFLWFVFGDRRLEVRFRRIIEDQNNEILISTASLWEIAIKNGKGNLALKAPYLEFVRANVVEGGITILTISLEHLDKVQQLPDHHRDPLDRMIISQSSVERLPIITSDPKFKLYNVELI